MIDSLSTYSGSSRPPSVAASSVFGTPDIGLQDLVVDDEDMLAMGEQMALFAPMTDALPVREDTLKALEESQRQSQDGSTRDQTLLASSSRQGRPTAGHSMLGGPVFSASPAPSEKATSEAGDDLPPLTAKRPTPPYNGRQSSLTRLAIPDHSINGPDSPGLMSGNTTAGPQTARPITNSVIDQMIAEAERMRKVSFIDCKIVLVSDCSVKLDSNKSQTARLLLLSIMQKLIPVI